MAALRTLMILIGALAVLTLGALAAAGPAEAAAPSCHGTEHGAPAGHDGPAKAAMPMACCVACVAAVPPQPSIRAAVSPLPPAHDGLSPLPPAGERPAPEPHPPRLTNS